MQGPPVNRPSASEPPLRRISKATPPHVASSSLKPQLGCDHPECCAGSGGQNRLLWRNLPAIGGLSVARRCSIGKWRSVLSSDARPPVDYKTHMLLGVRPNGIMTVLADWPYVPRQAEVQEQIDVTPESYGAFV